VSGHGAKRCIGFGQHEGICAYSATVQPALLWCQRCETLREEAITVQMENITAGFGEIAAAAACLDGSRA
jgi:hypothetical protein